MLLAVDDRFFLCTDEEKCYLCLQKYVMLPTACTDTLHLCVSEALTGRWWPLCSPSQVGGGLSVLPLSGLSHGHVDALQPLLGVLLIVSFQHVRLTVREDLEGPWQTSITSLLGYDLWRKR